MKKRVYFYGFDLLNNIVDVKFLQDEAITATNMKRLTQWMASTKPNITTIIAVDDREGLRQDYWDAIKGDFTDKLAFCDLLIREGIVMW